MGKTFEKVLGTGIIIATAPIWIVPVGLFWLLSTKEERTYYTPEGRRYLLNGHSH